MVIRLVDYNKNYISKHKELDFTSKYSEVNH